MRHFVLVAPQMSLVHQRQFRDSLGDAVGWWHQIPGVWLIADPNHVYEASELTGIVQRIAPNVECVSLQVDPQRWSTRLKTEKSDANEAWLNKHWNRDDETV